MTQLNDYTKKAIDYALTEHKAAGDVVPSIAGFSIYVMKARSTIYKWAGESKEFKEALELIKTKQENLLINGGLTGNFNAQVTKLMMSNHGYAEKQQQDISVSKKEIDPLKDIFEQMEE